MLHPSKLINSDIAPLQPYSSAIIFAPTQSAIRTTFERPVEWISRVPKVPSIWDLELQKLEANGSSFNAMAFLPDGQLIVSSDKTVLLWNAATGEEVPKLKGHSDLVIAVAYSADGQLIASTSHDCAVRLWNAATGQELQKLEGHSNSVRAVAFSRNG
jgi:WD40 repeat protein